MDSQGFPKNLEEWRNAMTLLKFLEDNPEEMKEYARRSARVLKFIMTELRDEMEK